MPERQAQRAELGLESEPLALILSRSGDVPSFPLLDDPEARPLILTGADAEPRRALEHLRAEHGVRSVLCEGGPRLNAGLLAAGVVDELFLTISPLLAATPDPLTILEGGASEPVDLDLVSVLEADGTLFLRYRLRALMTEPAQSVHELVSELDYPMFIVTVSDGRERSGCLIGFATQCSIAPAALLGVHLREEPHPRRRAAGRQRDRPPRQRSRTPASPSCSAPDRRRIDKFERCAWHDGPGGAPVLDDCENWFAAGSSSASTPATTRPAARPVRGARGTAERPFTFHRARRIEPGHAP